MSNLPKKASGADDEVEELLRAAEEDIFLKLSINSHTLRGSSSRPLPPDLDRRFHALKSTNKSQPHVPNHPKPPQINTINDGDLLGRFDALKKTLPSYQDHRVGAAGSVGEEEGEEEDEVEKLIRWAVDAARLDTKDGEDEIEDESEDESEESDDDYDSEEDSVKKPQKGKGKGKGSKKK